MVDRFPGENSPVIRTRTSVTLQRVLDLLDDGEWHDRDLIYEQALSAVPPGVALRYAQLKRFHMAKKKAQERFDPVELAEWLAENTADNWDGGQKRSRDVDGTIRAGARSKIADSVNKSARIERRTLPEGRVQLRRIPLAEKARRRLGIEGGEAAHDSE